MIDPLRAFGTTRERGPTVSYSEIERAARALMAAGERPTGKAVLEHLGRGSPNHINECMRRFWKDQAAINAGDPIALTRLPPELAESAEGLWEQALRLAQQTARVDDSAARAKLEDLKRDTDTRARSIELREKEWDMAARVRERALAETREQVNVLLTELATATSELRYRDARIADLESHIETDRRRIATLIAKAINKSRAIRAAKKRPANRAPVSAPRARIVKRPRRKQFLAKRIPRKR